MSISNINTLSISFYCPNCKSPIETDIENAHYDWKAEDPSDGLRSESSTVQCSECARNYEIDVIAKGGEKEVKVRWFPSIKVSFHDDTYDVLEEIEDTGEYERFLAEYEPADAYDEFKYAINKLDDIRYGSTFYHGTEETILRMIYQNYISALEAYLSDTLIDIITNDKEKLISLIGSMGALRDLQIKLIEIAKDESFATTKAKSFLQGFSFHNLPEVSRMYKAVLGVNFIENKEHEERLLQIIKTRHHIVHRNGKDNSGKQVNISESAISDLRINVKEIVEKVKRAVDTYKNEGVPF